MLPIAYIVLYLRADLLAEQRKPEESLESWKAGKKKRDKHITIAWQGK